MLAERIRMLPFYRDEQCFIWVGGHDSNGAPVLTDTGQRVLVNRVVYREFVGPIPGGRVVRRSCRRLDCINPSHLYIRDERDEVT